VPRTVHLGYRTITVRTRGWQSIDTITHPEPHAMHRHAAAFLFAAVLLGACSSNGTTSAGAPIAATRSTAPTATAAITEPTTPPPTPTTETSSPSPTPAWEPCDTEAFDYEDTDACGDFYEDTCDAVYAGSKDGRAQLIDLMIDSADEVDEKRLKACPQFLDEWKIAKSGFGEGSQEVGKDIKAGRYKTLGEVGDCYWERTSVSGKILDNDFVTVAKKITVTIRRSDGFFTSQNCGNWIPA
jgi:hypothetical protein